MTIQSVLLQAGGVLDTALRMLCRELEKHASCRMEFSSFGDFSGLHPRVRNYVFRIVQEALSNVIRHSNAELCGINISRRGGHLVLMVEDNGRGMDLHAISHGNGIYNMKERARLLGGIFDLESVPGHGTTLRVKIPDPQIQSS